MWRAWCKQVALSVCAPSVQQINLFICHEFLNRDCMYIIYKKNVTVVRSYAIHGQRPWLQITRLGTFSKLNNSRFGLANVRIFRSRLPLELSQLHFHHKKNFFTTRCSNTSEMFGIQISNRFHCNIVYGTLLGICPHGSVSWHVLNVYASKAILFCGS
jgi:hypothetical protein